MGARKGEKNQLQFPFTDKQVTVLRSSPSTARGNGLFVRRSSSFFPIGDNDTLICAAVLSGNGAPKIRIRQYRQIKFQVATGFVVMMTWLLNCSTRFVGDFLTSVHPQAPYLSLCSRPKAIGLSCCCSWMCWPWCPPPLASPATAARIGCLITGIVSFYCLFCFGRSSCFRF